MNMRKRLRFHRHITLLCLPALLLNSLAPNVAFARDKQPLGWDNVLRLRTGATIAVVLFSKKAYRGKVDRVEPTNLVLTTAAGSQIIPREEIKSVTTVAKPKVANPGLWAIGGGALVVGVGGLVGAAKDIGDINRGSLSGSTGKHGEAIEVAGLLVVAGGLAAVVLVGKPRVIYEAKQAPPSTAK